MQHAFLLSSLHRLIGSLIAQMVGVAQGLVTVELNLLQMTYSCTAPLLSETGMYPTVRGALLRRLRCHSAERCPHCPTAEGQLR